MTDAEDAASATNAWLENLGEAQVRLLLTNGGIPQGHHTRAIEWLAQKDRDSKQKIAAAQADQTEISRSAKDAAWAAAGAAERSATAAERANRRATIAIVVAAMSALATVAVGAISYLAWAAPSH